MAIPCGTALGYISGGLFAEFGLWRVPFISEGIAMVPLALLCILIPSSYHKKKKKEDQGIEISTKSAASPIVSVSGETLDEKSNLVATPVSPPPADPDASQPPLEAETPKDYSSITPDDSQVASPNLPEEPEPVPDLPPATAAAGDDAADEIKKYNIFVAIFKLLTNPIYVTSVAGYSMYTFVIGALAFWAPTYIHKTLNMDVAQASIGFSICSVVTGFLGTIAGGIFVDRLGGNKGTLGVSKSLLYCAVFLGIAFPLGMIGLVLRNKYVFFPLIGIAEFMLFCTTAPTNGILLSCVEKGLRSYAMAFSIFCIHIVGDFPSPIIVGAISDALHGDLHTPIILLWTVLLFAIALWLLASFLALLKHRREIHLHIAGKAEKDAKD